MCGIFGVYNREGSFDEKHIDTLFIKAEERGQDGCGIVVFDGFELRTKKFVGKYSDNREEILEMRLDAPKSVILGICRAQPETEPESLGEDTCQPIVKDGLALVHNGTVMNSTYEELEKVAGYMTRIDSEAILNAYIMYNGNMEKVMSKLQGGYAFILLDTKTKRLICVNDFKPMSIGYVRKIGFLVHSQLEAIQQVVEKITDCKRCGTNIWEDYYFHYQDGYTIRDVDLDSGMERVTTFKPNYYHPVWDKSKSASSNEVVLVSSSGGIDSGLTAAILHKLDYQVKLIHFDYGQKGEMVESSAVAALAMKYALEYEIYNLRDLFENDSSMLIRDDIRITTGEEEYIKSTAAWVSNRNGVFLSYLVSLAEQLILSNRAGKVYIASGMSNLSEEGFYPDNSESFIRAFFESVRYSTITSDNIAYVPLLQQIMKSEEWLLGDRLDFPFKLTTSCDHPRIKDGQIQLCNQCGSTQLSRWAAEMAGVEDPRHFYDRDDTEVMKKKFSGMKKHLDIVDVIERIRFIKNTDKNKLLGVLC